MLSAKCYVLNLEFPNWLGGRCLIEIRFADMKDSVLSICGTPEVGRALSTHDHDDVVILSLRPNVAPGPPQRVPESLYAIAVREVTS